MTIINQKETLNQELFKQRIVVWDTETTGRYHKKGDRMIQFSGVEIIDGEITRFYETKLNPISYDEKGKPFVKQIDEEAFQVHKISNQDLESEPTFKDKQQEIIEFMKGAICIAHNEKFDIGFLNSELKIVNGESSIQFKDFVKGNYDTYLLSRAFDSYQTTHGLDRIVQRANRPEFSSILHIPEWKNESNVKEVDLSIRTKQDENSRHDALIDCALLAKYILYILKEKWDLSKLKDFVEKEKPLDFQPFTLPQNYSPVLSISTEEELNLSEKYFEVFKPKEIEQKTTKSLKI